jgi:regulator of protease activity HflC (stomatin/prohibitin superfamily)
MSSTNVVTAFGFYKLNPDEIGVKLFLGRLVGIVGPGVGFIIPIFTQIRKTHSSLQTVDLPNQQIVLSGNIAVTISGSLNFKVQDPGKALLGVLDYRYSIHQLAMTTIADVLGTKTIEEVRSQKGDIAEQIEKVVARQAARWGIGEVDIRLTDAKLDDSLLRAMMRETEARKEANATMIKAEADKAVAETFADAARTLSSSPGAMTLRILQTLSDVSNTGNSVVIPIPTEFLPMQGRIGMAAASLPQPMHPSSSAVGSFPTAKVTTKSNQQIAACPQCATQYRVDEIRNDPKYDARPDVDGLQLRCANCQVIFELQEG